ncbi:MAG: cobalamin-binding protein [candidate division KSB1 bacterium]|nr:cobalamin-binding protein [candidate division KSB1 bacterium]MDQ7063329.1 cobalamin-binding protein [candidate division KSB1 bacterium]
MPAKRVVTLIASATEIVCALGLEDWLVGRSHECDYPPSVQSLPVCTEVKFQTDGRSYEIDQRVKAIVEEGVSVYRVRSDVLNRLRPDVIITQTQCEVCAVSLRDVEEAVCELVESRPQIVSLHPDCLADVWEDIRRVGRALGVADRAERLVQQLQARMEAIANEAKSATKRRRAACIEWIDPLMAAGNWMPELVEMAGGIHLFGEAGKHSPFMSWDELRRADPDILLIHPCGFDIARTLEEMPVLTQRPDWGDLRAVQQKQVFVLDGNQYFNRPGPRLVESLEILAEIFHPSLFQFGHEGRGWVRFLSR